MTQFNLQGALAGKALITRSGQTVTSFRKTNDALPLNIFQYSAEIDSEVKLFTAEGKYHHSEASRFDLFMKDSPCPRKDDKFKPKSDFSDNTLKADAKAQKDLQQLLVNLRSSGATAASRTITIKTLIKKLLNEI